MSPSCVHFIIKLKHPTSKHSISIHNFVFTPPPPPPYTHVRTHTYIYLFHRRSVSPSKWPPPPSHLPRSDLRCAPRLRDAQERGLDPQKAVGRGVLCKSSHLPESRRQTSARTALSWGGVLSGFLRLTNDINGSRLSWYMEAAQMCSCGTWSPSLLHRSPKELYQKHH